MTAKFRLITIPIFLLMAFAPFNKLFAQGYYEEVPRTFYGGLVAGVNFCQVDGDRYSRYNKIGANVGGIVYTHLAPKLAASVEILYSQKGSRGRKPQSSTSHAYTIDEYNINLNYAEVPVMINYFDKRKSNFGIGISYSQLISAEETIKSRPAFPVADMDEAYPFQKWDLNFLIGGNLKLMEHLLLNLRFQYSIVPIRRNVHPELGRSEQYNNMLALRLMWLF